MRGIKDSEAKLFIEEAMGEITSSILSKVEVLGLILTGGATSLTICQKLHADKVSIVEEIEPGIPLIKLEQRDTRRHKGGGIRRRGQPRPGDAEAEEDDVKVRPLLAITMGDVAGIGPEIIAKALDTEEVYRVCRPLVVGDAGAMNMGMEVAKLSLVVKRIDLPSRRALQARHDRYNQPRQHRHLLSHHGEAAVDGGEGVC